MPPAQGRGLLHDRFGWADFLVRSLVIDGNSSGARRAAEALGVKDVIPGKHFADYFLSPTHNQSMNTFFPPSPVPDLLFSIPNSLPWTPPLCIFSHFSRRRFTQHMQIQSVNFFYC
jgi:hypothetical protein